MIIPFSGLFDMAQPSRKNNLAQLDPKMR